MWDAKRQFIWLAAGLALGTFVAFTDAHDEDGMFVPRFFVFMESLVLGIIALLFISIQETANGKKTVTANSEPFLNQPASRP